MSAVDVQNLTGMVSSLGVIWQVEVSVRFVGIAVSQHVESVTGVILADSVNYTFPRPSRCAQRVEENNGIATPFLYEVHVSRWCGYGIC